MFFLGCCMGYVDLYIPCFCGHLRVIRRYFFFFDGVNRYHLWNHGPRHKSHPYSLHPWHFTLSEVTKLRTTRAARGQLCFSSCAFSDAFAGASSLRQIKVTSSESRLWSSRYDNVTKSFRQSLAFPGPLPPAPPALRWGPGFRVALLRQLPYKGVGEVRLGDFCARWSVQVSWSAWLVFLSYPPLQFYLKSTPSLARKCCP